MGSTILTGGPGTSLFQPCPVLRSILSPPTFDHYHGRFFRDLIIPSVVRVITVTWSIDLLKNTNKMISNKIKIWQVDLTILLLLLTIIVTNILIKGLSGNTYSLINFIICVLQGTSNNNAAFNA